MNTRILTVLTGMGLCIALAIWSTWSRAPTTVPQPAAEAATEEVQHAPQKPAAAADNPTPPSHREAAASEVPETPPAAPPQASPAASQETVLTVHIVNADGSPGNASGKVEWSRYTRIGAGYLVSPAGELEVDGSVVKITGMQPGERLDVRLTEPARFQVKQRVQMPAGLHKHEITLIRGKATPQLEIPIVDEAGAAITDQEFKLFVQLANGFPETHLKTPDPHGVIRLDLSRAGAGKIEIGQRHRRGVLHTFAGKRLKRPYNTTFGGPDPEDIAYAVREFPLMEPGTRHRLDPVVAHVPKPRITGTVLGVDGKPAARTTILLGHATLPEPTELVQFKTTTDSTGKFEIVAGLLPEHIYLCARGNHEFSEPLQVATGDNTPIVLQLQPTGSMSLSVRAAPQLSKLTPKHGGMVTPEVSLTIDPASLRNGWWTHFRHQSIIARSVGNVWNQTVYVRGMSPLLITDVLPQSYDVHFFVHGNRDLRLRKVAVRAGEVSSPATLNDYLVGSEIEGLTVRVRNPDGTAPTQAFVIVHMPPEAHASYHNRSSSTNADGDATFFLPRATVADVEVQSYGRISQRIPAATLPLDVVLNTGTQLAVSIEGLGAVHNAGSFSVSARKYDDKPMATPMMSGPNSLWPPYATVNASQGTASLSNLAPGTYRVWLVCHDAKKAAPAKFVALRDITVAPGKAKTVDFAHQLTAEQAGQLSW